MSTLAIYVLAFLVAYSQLTRAQAIDGNVLSETILRLVGEKFYNPVRAKAWVSSHQH